MLLVTGTIFFAHFQRIENMYLRAGNSDLIRQRRNHIRIKLIFAALHSDIRTSAAQHFQKSSRVFRHLLFPLFHSLLQESPFHFSVPYHRIDQRHCQIDQQFCSKRRCLIQVRTSQNAIVHLNVLPCGKQSYERAAQRAAVCCPDMSAAVFLDICLYFFCFLQHSRKLALFCFIKAIVADAENVIICRQQRNNVSEIALPVAAGSRQQ